MITDGENISVKYAGLGLERLLALPTVPAPECRNWGTECVGATTPSQPAGPFASIQEYRFCKAVVEYPMLGSSEYPPLAGISSRTAQPIRTKLIEAGLIRQHIFDADRRGPHKLLLEPLPAGKEAVEQYQQKEKP